MKLHGQTHVNINAQNICTDFTCLVCKVCRVLRAAYCGGPPQQSRFFMKATLCWAQRKWIVHIKIIQGLKDGSWFYMKTHLNLSKLLSDKQTKISQESLFHRIIMCHWVYTTHTDHPAGLSPRAKPRPLLILWCELWMTNGRPKTFWQGDSSPWWANKSRCNWIHKAKVIVQLAPPAQCVSSSGFPACLMHFRHSTVVLWLPFSECTKEIFI